MRSGEKIYYCKRTSEDNAEINTYDVAEELVLRPRSIFSAVSVTVQPKNGFTDRMAYGETTQSDQRVILTPYRHWDGVFKSGDVFYIDGITPTEDEEWNGQNANYYVEFVAKQEEAIELSLKQIRNN